MSTSAPWQHWLIRHATFLGCLCLALAVGAAYSDVYPNDFVLDDQALLITNDYLRHWNALPDILTRLNYDGAGLHQGFYRPVPMVLHLVWFQLFGLSSTAFHTLNILLQMINALLVWRLGCRLVFDPRGAFAAALLWAVHPFAIEAVTYMSATPEILWMTFTLLGLLALLPEITMQRGVIAAFYFLLALGCKETAVIFPALACTVLFVTSRQRLQPRTYFKTAPFWAMALAYVVAYFSLVSYRPEYAMYHSSSDYAQHILIRIYTCLATLPDYLSLILYPTHLHPEKSFPAYTTFFAAPVILGALIVLAALLHIALSRGQRGIALTFGLLWFAIALSPCTGIVVPVDALIAEHWIYLPAAGLFLGIAETIATSLNRRGWRFAAVGVLAAALMLGAKTYRQNTVWLNPATFYDNIQANGGHMLRAYPDLGVYYLNQQDFEKSAFYFRKALQEGDERNTPVYAIHLQLAFAYIGVSADKNYIVTTEMVKQALPYSTHVQEALEQIKLAEKINPNVLFLRQLEGIIEDWLREPPGKTR